MIFKDRKDAGQKLAEILSVYAGPETVVYALPRGGAIVGAEIAKKLKAPLDLIIIRKIGHPENSEYALCVLSESQNLTCNESDLPSIDKEWLANQVKLERKEIKRRRQLYLGGQPGISAKDKVAILVDDGVATGLTIKAAASEIKSQGPKKLIVAAGVASEETVESLQRLADEVIVLEVPEDFSGAVGTYFEDFSQVDDQEVVQALNR